MNNCFSSIYPHQLLPARSDGPTIRHATVFPQSHAKRQTSLTRPSTRITGKMAKRKEPKAKDLKLKQPDRSGPTEKTLLDMAQEKDLFTLAKEREAEIQREKKRAAGEVVEDKEEEEDEEDNVMSIGAERFIEAVLWTATLAMLHLTFDVLVQHQYNTELDWRAVWIRTGRAFVVFFLLFYPLHPHEANPTLLPGLPLKYQAPLRQVIFFTASAIAGCYLIYITNTYGYLAVMKQAPPVGCLWVWSVIELDLTWAVLSLALSGGFFYQGGYSIS